MKHGNNISTSHQNIVLNPTNIQHNHIIVSASEAISPTYEENEGLVERGEGDTFHARCGGGRRGRVEKGPHSARGVQREDAVLRHNLLLCCCALEGFCNTETVHPVLCRMLGLVGEIRWLR